MDIPAIIGPPPPYGATPRADALFSYQSRPREDRTSSAVVVGLTGLALATLPITMGLSLLLPGFYAEAAQKRRTPRFHQFSKHLFSTLGALPTREASALLVGHLVRLGVLTADRAVADLAMLDTALRSFRWAGQPLRAEVAQGVRECVQIFAAECQRAHELGTQRMAMAACLQHQPSATPSCPPCSEDELKELERDMSTLPSRRELLAPPPYTPT